MSAERRDPDDDRIFDTDLHPRHESWAQISTQGTMIGFVIFLVMAALFALWISLRY